MQEELHAQLQAYYAYYHKSNYLYEQWAKKHQLSFHALFVLSALWENRENCNQKYISEKWMIPKQTINTILKNFQKQNWIALESMPSDKRNKKITLTPSGQAHAEKIIGALTCLEESVLKQMQPQDRAAMIRCNELFLSLFQDAMKHGE